MRFVALLVLVFVPSVALAHPGVNSVLGDDSYVARFGAPPDSGVAEDVRLRIHLEYVEALLRTADTTTLDAAHRARPPVAKSPRRSTATSSGRSCPTFTARRSTPGSNIRG
jgi:hypothetical protein